MLKAISSFIDGLFGYRRRPRKVNLQFKPRTSIKPFGYKEDSGAMNLDGRYQKIRRVQENDVKLLLLEIASSLSWTDNDRVLDVGCSYGTITKNVLLPRCKKLTAIDSSPKMIEYAKKHSSAANLEYHVADIEDRDILPVKWEERFSKVFSFHYLHWVTDQRKALENIYRLLEPEGECIFLFITWADVWDVVNDLTMKKKWRGYLKGLVNHIPQSHYQSPDERIEWFEDLLKDVGFDVMTCDEIQSSFIYSTDEDCRGVLQLLCPNTTSLLSATRDEFIASCLLEFQRRKKANRFHQKDFCYAKMIVHAKKRGLV